jgi:hypothetical protein
MHASDMGDYPTAFRTWRGRWRSAVPEALEGELDLRAGRVDNPALTPPLDGARSGA